MKVTHVITGLECGGAEMMLLKVLRASRDTNAQVVSLTRKGPGALGDTIQALGIGVRYLDLRGPLDAPRVSVQLLNALQTARPTVVQTWLYHSDLLGGLVARVLGIPVVWGIRAAAVPERELPRMTQAIIHTCAHLSHIVPARITVNSQASRRIHEALGYPASKMVVIPNGFDLEQFQPDSRAGVAVRAELALEEDVPLIGYVARFHPLKDHDTFFRAARFLSERHHKVHFVLCGSGISPDNSQLVALARSAGVLDRCHLLGRRTDTPRILAGIDLATLTSSTESFPNVVGEAMACGTCCVTTDVGDCRDIIGETGSVVPPRSPQKLAQAWAQLLELPRSQRSARSIAARKRVQDYYSIEAAAAAFAKLYREVELSRNQSLHTEG